jgi:hypothetical protein
VIEELSRSRTFPLLALRVISPARNDQVAFGSKRTFDGRRQRLARSKIIHCGPYQRTYTNFMIKPAASAPTILLKVRRLETSDVAAYRELRLESLKGHPEAFGSSWEDEAGKPISWWSQRLETNAVFGGWVNRSPWQVCACRKR